MLIGKTKLNTIEVLISKTTQQPKELLHAKNYHGLQNNRRTRLGFEQYEVILTKEQSVLTKIMS